MPFSVETISQKWAFDIISRVFSFAVDTFFEKAKAGFTCFHFEPEKVDFEICFAAPC